jgi:sec-independent protein translocase protein TatC
MATAEVSGLSDDQKNNGKSDPPEGEAGSMTLWEHLEELRSRIVRMALAFLVGAGGCWFYKEQILAWVTQPYKDAWIRGGHSGPPALHFGSPPALFIAYIRLAALAGLVFALPIILYQVWAFIAPGLYAREKKFTIPFVASSVLLFLAGGYFGWAVAFPAAFDFLINFKEDLPGGMKIEATVMVGDYIEFITRMFIAFGATAELPILAVFLTVAGIITHRHLIKFFRYFIVVAFIISAILTPPDPMSQILMAVPLIALYGVSILVSWAITVARERDQSASADDTAKEDEPK